MQSLTERHRIEPVEKHLLVVDDDVKVRKLLKSILARRRYHCTTAIDASQARLLVQRRRFDLVLCDIHMPGESGLDFIRFLNAEHPDIAFVMVSVENDPNIAEEALEIGAYGYVVKPFDKHQVLIQIANALRRQQLERKTRANQSRLEDTIDLQTRKLADLDQQVRHKEAALTELNVEIDNVRHALQTLMEQRGKIQQQCEENILANIKFTLMPYIENLKHSHLSREQLSIADVLEEKLNTLVSPMVKKLTSAQTGLTPTELLVADLVKHGKQTKEIAEFLNLSQNTIITHRYNIRRKLGLMNTKTNLRNHLQTLES